MDNNEMLRVSGISKSFPGVKALNRVDFSLRKGEIHALVGENGAGKSTLMNILSGVIPQDEGKLLIDQKIQKFNGPLDAVKAGIGIVFQELSLIQNLSVAENLFAGRQKTNFAGFIDFRNLYARTRELLSAFSESLDPRTPVKNLSIAKQQVVEILKAVSHNPKILILDEPTSSLTHKEIDKLFKLLEEMKTNGISIIYISHHIQEIFRIADRVTVLRDGKYIATRNVAEIDEPEVISMMVGRKITHNHINRDSSIDRNTPVLQVRNLSHKKYFTDINFEVFKGEIVSMAGLVGAGRTEIARTIFGLFKPSHGTLLINGKKITPNSPVEAIAGGIAYATENRKSDGLFLDMTISENSIAPQLSNFTHRRTGFLNQQKIDSFVENNIRTYGIRTSTAQAKARKLSGGNQQKVLLSMWLGVAPKVLIVDEPTKGVDIGAKNEIFSILRHLADTGTAILVISSDLLEIIAISDRVLVVKNGRINGEMPHQEITEKRVIAYASGITSNNSYQMETTT
jgi:ABC-type sugar transport system ATPase subunit